MSEEPIPQNPFGAPDEVPPHVNAMIIAFLTTMAAHPEIRRVRAAARQALAAQPGQRLLDAGCGAGEIARELAATVGPAGEVVALDFSAATVAAAAERHDGSSVRYLAGDVTALEFPDATFDGVRSERVIQHVTDPDLAIAELVRVTRPGGRVCLIDTDWDSLAVDGLPEDLLTPVREHLSNRVMVHHRGVGRTLRRRLVRAGALDVTATPVTCCFLDPAAADVLPMFNPDVASRAGMVPDELREPWFAALAGAGERGEFLAALTIWVVAGTRPR